MPPIITLTTDFGTEDSYAAALKGVILSINREAVIIDLCHFIKPQNVFEAAFVFGNAYRYFPQGTIHLVVVDPGVGSERQAIILKTPSAFFVAPDNGILSYIINELCLPPDHPTRPFVLEERRLQSEVEAVAITNPRFWRQSVSPTFHGRDIFAPVTAALSLGISFYEFGEKIASLHSFSIPQPFFSPEGNVIGCVLHIDHFGNIISNIKSSDLPKAPIIKIGRQEIHGLSHFYAESEGLLAITGSSDYLEIALRGGNASTFLDTRVGDEIVVSPQQGSQNG